MRYKRVATRLPCNGKGLATRAYDRSFRQGVRCDLVGVLMCTESGCDPSGGIRCRVESSGQCVFVYRRRGAEGSKALSPLPNP